MDIGLALSGGGTKAAVHIGVIKALEEKNIKITHISGTSSGSIIAVLYAIGYSSDEMMKLFKKYCKEIEYVDIKNIIKLIYGVIIKRKIIISGLNNGKKLEKIIEKCCLEKNIKNIQDIKMPLIIPTVNLENGELIVFSSLKKINNRTFINDKITYLYDGKISEIVAASCAYPGVFSPIKYKNKYLIDGGIRENVPWKELKQLGVKRVVASCFDEKIEKQNLNSFIEIIERALKFSNHELANYELGGVDYLIKTKLEKTNLLDTSKIDEIYKRGYEEAKMKIKEML